MQKHNTVYTVYCIARLQPVAGLIYWVLLIVTDAYAADDALNLIVSGVKLWTVMGPQHSLKRRKEVESFALEQLNCVERNMHRCSVLLKKYLQR